MAITERDVVLTGKGPDGNETIDYPLTRLGWIDGEAEVKSVPSDGDYVPVIDGGQMKKTPVSALQAPGTAHIEDTSVHVTAAEKQAWNSMAAGDHAENTAIHVTEEEKARWNQAAEAGADIEFIQPESGGDLLNYTGKALIEASGNGSLSVKHLTIPAGRMLGDVNWDGLVNDVDAGLIKDQYMRKIDLSDPDYDAADINGDGGVNMSDYQKVSFNSLGTYSRDLLGVWSKNPNYATEDAVFYVDVDVDGVTAGSAGVLAFQTIGTDWIDRVEPMAGKLRIYAKLLPVQAVPCILFLYPVTAGEGLEPVRVWEIRNPVEASALITVITACSLLCSS